MLDVFAHSSGITDKEVAEAAAMIGVPLRVPQFNHEATLDTIRHYAHGLGDDNPLWCDEHYAATSVYGGIVAPPTFGYSIFSPGITPGFDGLQVFFGTGRWEIARLARRGERIIPRAKLIDQYEAAGRRARRMIVQVGETQYATPDGELIATNISTSLRVPRANQEDGLKYEPRKSYVYSAKELEDIGNQVLGQTRRGAEPLYGDDVTVGDELPKRVKGPLNTATLMTYYAGNLNGAGYRACEMQWQTRHLATHHPEQIWNNRSRGWLMEATWPGMGHLENEVAEAVGMPAAYDNGWMRLGWVGQVATDWMGDHGALRMLEVRHVAPNIMGDTLWCGGTVLAKRREGDNYVLELSLDAYNQLGQASCKGSAEVILPSRP
ncbi:MAG: hypothetical protein JWO15_1391 [Sphingomonadales bacterium]|nr:hypothetical protein [Sphingomonadales bacterium]